MSRSGERVVAGRYRLRRRLGQGAMGTVWEAFDEFLRRPVAVKEVLLPPGMPDAQAAELRERTLREARAIAALSHPNVVTLHDVAREDGEPFVVMEFVHAHSLAALVDVLGPLPEAKAAAIADAVAAGLAAAHQVGITHRDVKPGNVLIGVDGRVKLTDFGIARNVAEATLTSTGIMLGSPAYIAPEVAAGREVTPAADLWGLGATLFAVIEGRPPYDVNGAVLATVNQVVHGDVPRPSTGGPLDEIVAALMVKEPGDRISLGEVRNRLHPLLPPPSTPLLTEEELARITEVAEQQQPSDDTDATDAEADPKPEASEEPEPESAATPEPVGPAALAADPGALPPSLARVAAARSDALASTPGPLPFDQTVRTKSRRSRGALATGIVAFLAVVLFFGAAGGGFALSRYVAGEPLLPPARHVATTNTPTSAQQEGEDQLEPRIGNAATAQGVQGGGFTVSVPKDWVEFIEEVRDDELVPSTRVYYLSPDGTRLVTVERLVGFYPDHVIDDYVDRLTSREPDVTIDNLSKVETSNKASEDDQPEAAVQLTYHATTNAQELVPDDPEAVDMNRSTYANLYPRGGDLWVVSLTVPIEQDEYASDLIGDIVAGFDVTG